MPTLLKVFRLPPWVNKIFLRNPFYFSIIDKIAFAVWTKKITLFANHIQTAILVHLKKHTFFVLKANDCLLKKI